MEHDMQQPKKWPRKLRNMAIEALRNERLHKARAARLVEEGIAVMIGQRCVVVLPARDALFRMMRPNTH